MLNHWTTSGVSSGALDGRSTCVYTAPLRPSPPPPEAARTPALRPGPPVALYSGYKCLIFCHMLSFPSALLSPFSSSF